MDGWSNQGEIKRVSNHISLTSHTRKRKSKTSFYFLFSLFSFGEFPLFKIDTDQLIPFESTIEFLHRVVCTVCMQCKTALLPCFEFLSCRQGRAGWKRVQLGVVARWVLFCGVTQWNPAEGFISHIMLVWEFDLRQEIGLDGILNKSQVRQSSLSVWRPEAWNVWTNYLFPHRVTEYES